MPSRSCDPALCICLLAPRGPSSPLLSELLVVARDPLGHVAAPLGSIRPALEPGLSMPLGFSGSSVLPGVLFAARRRSVSTSETHNSKHVPQNVSYSG